MTKCKPSIVNSVQSDFHTHILDCDTSAWLHVVIADRHDEGVDSLIFLPDDSLSEDDGVVSVAGAISDPEFLGQH